MRQIRFNRSLTKYNYAEEFAYLARQPQTHAIVKMRDDLLYDIHMRGYPSDFAFRPEFSRDKVLREIYSQKAYNPAQPRLPRSQPGAGEWVGDNSRRTRLALGPQLHNPAVRDDAQHNVQFAPANPGYGRGGGIGALLGAIDRYNQQTNQQRGTAYPEELTSVIEFESREYSQDSSAQGRDVAFTRSLTEAETLKACPRLAEVQSRLDRINQEVREQSPVLSPQQHGTAVHYRLAREINDQDNLDFIAERSYLKERDTDYYGQSGSIRIDAEEKVSSNLVCVYDVKTGFSGLSLARYNEIANRYFVRSPPGMRLIITEVRPKR